MIVARHAAWPESGCSNWRIVDGEIDVFHVASIGSSHPGRWRHLFRLGPGDPVLIDGATNSVGGGRLLAVAVHRATLAALAETDLDQAETVWRQRLQLILGPTAPAWTAGMTRDAWYGLVAAALDRAAADGAAAATARQRRRHSAASQILSDAESQVVRAVGADDRAVAPTAASGSDIGALVGRIALAEGYDPTHFQSPDLSTMRDPYAALREYAEATGVTWRETKLEPSWWRRSGGAMIGRWREDGRLVALIDAGGRYWMEDGPEHRRTPVDAGLAARLGDRALVPQWPLPSGPLSPADLVRYALRGRRGDVLVLVLAAAIVASLGLLTPTFTAVIFDQIIPNADRSLIPQTLAMLIGAAVASSLLRVAQGLSLSRLRGMGGGRLQVAVMNRLMSLPVHFFRGFEVGDLAARTAAVNTIEGLLTGAVVTASLSGLFSLINLAMMLWYDWRMALAGVGATLVVVAGLVLALRRQLRYTRDRLEQQAQFQSALLQAIRGIAKIRVAHAETLVLAGWLRRFGRVVACFRAERSLAAIGARFSEAAQGGAMLAFFILFALYAGGAQAGVFVAFNSAFGQFFGGVMALYGAGAALAAIVPEYDRARPLLEAVSEKRRRGAVGADWAGAVEFDHVHFRYGDDRSAVLTDLSFKIEPGMFAAIVGPSGAGKSTLVRLMTGMEQPNRGRILIDDRDLAHIDLPSFRRDIGVVMQNGQLLPGTVRDAIAGQRAIGNEAIWTAARIAGIADDLAALPMGLNTVISEGAGNLSGGQRQRLMIARALIGQPRLLIFDEATSALDNATQKSVSDAVAALNLTRVVVAHRLSTVAAADRIFFLDGGRIVQTGSYAELVATPGPFADFARRQLTE